MQIGFDARDKLTVICPALFMVNDGALNLGAPGHGAPRQSSGRMVASAFGERRDLAGAARTSLAAINASEDVPFAVPYSTQQRARRAAP